MQPARLASDQEIERAARAPLASNDRAYLADIAPFRVMGELYYVGPEGVSSFLIHTGAGEILIDGGPAQAAPLIEAHIAALGFSIHDVKYLLNTHAHYDHAGGLAQLQRDSGAIFAASAGDKPFLEAGRIDYGPSANVHFPPLRVDRVITDGAQIVLGGVTLEAHLTPGHTPGCTSWSLEVAGGGGAAHHAFIDCSETVAGQRLAPQSYAHMIDNYRATFAKVGAFNADIFLASHGVMFDLDAKRARQIAGDANAFVDPGGLQRYNEAMQAAFNIELAHEQGAQR